MFTFHLNCVEKFTFILWTMVFGGGSWDKAKLDSPLYTTFSVYYNHNIIHIIVTMVLKYCSYISILL